MVAQGDREGSIKAILDTFNPEGSTRHVGFNTRKETYATDAQRSHVSHVAMDSGWEGEFARVAEGRDDILSYVKNQGLGLEVPYRDGNVPRMYVPDFILRIDTGEDEPLNLIVEVKGYRGEAAAIKAETIRTQWIPGVNNLGSFGRWAFAELRDVYDFKPELERVITGVKWKTS
jgi:type III restriction enzyme